MAERKTPELRFEGFDGYWEEKKFSELYKKVTEKNDYSFDTEKIISVANMFYNPDNTVTDKEYLLTYNIMRLGDIAFEGHANKDYAHGRFVENYIGDGIVSHIFDVFRPIVKQDVNFWRYCINNEKVMQKPLQRSTKSATMMNNLVSEDFLLESIKIPNEKEQQQIGSFFKNLDQQILLTQEKLEKTKTLKKTMLQKMFPQEGSRIPEIRLEGFSGEWEEKKFGVVFGTTNERNHPELPVLSASQELGMIVRDTIGIDITYDKKNISTYKIVKPGNFVIHLRSFQGGFAHSRIEGITSPAYTILEFKEAKHDDSFWKHLLTSKAFIKSLEIVTYGIRDGRSINYEDVSALKMKFPSQDEQKAISAFFDNLSEMITTQTQKLELLKTLKKSLLEKMFV